MSSFVFHRPQLSLGEQSMEHTQVSLPKHIVRIRQVTKLTQENIHQYFEVIHIKVRGRLTQHEYGSEQLEHENVEAAPVECRTRRPIQQVHDVLAERLACVQTMLNVREK